MNTSRKIEKLTAVASFVVAAVLAFTALFLSKDHEIAAGVVMVIAQFLLLTASIFGIDYTFYYHGTKFSTARSPQQQPA